MYKKLLTGHSYLLKNWSRHSTHERCESCSENSFFPKTQTGYRSAGKPMSSQSPWLRIGLLYFGVSVLYMNIYYIPPLTVTFVRELGMTYLQVGLLSTSFMIAFSVSNIFIGILSDRINQKKIMVWGLLLGFFCSFLFAFSSHFRVMMVLRAGLGLSTACMIAPCLVYILSVVPQKASLGISGHVASITLGLSLAFLLTPLLAEIIAWRTIVVLNACLIGMAVVTTVGWVESPPPCRIDSAGVHAAIASRSGLMVLFSILFLIFIQIGANTIWLAPWLEEKCLFSPDKIGVGSMAFQMMGIPSSLIGGYIYGKTRNLLYLGSVGMFLSTINTSYVILEGSDSFGPILLAIMLSRGGAFVCVGPLMSMVPKFVGAGSRGLTLGSAHTICAIGIMFSSFMGGFIIEQTGGYHLLWVISAVCVACSALILNPLFNKRWGTKISSSNGTPMEIHP
jgi:predicted MFS family arabinose efflux permease